MSQKQARAFAKLIYADIHQFCEDHKAEFEVFLHDEEKEGEENDFSAD